MPNATLLRIAIPAATAVAAVALAPLASAPAAPRGALTLVARLDRHSLVKVDARPRGSSPGDTVVFSASLRRAGKLDGRAEFTQTIVDPRYRGVSMRADLLLGDGTLELVGSGLSRRAPGAATPASETDMAIAGGTGAYAGATGVVHLVPTGRTAQRLEVTFGS